MKLLLSVTAILEAITGFALVAAPSLFVSIMLGSPLDVPVEMIIARIAGTALFSLAIACWLSRNNEGASGVVKAMLLYNAVVAALLVYAGLATGLTGIGLWPAVLLHAGLAVWCVVSHRGKKFVA